MVRAPPRRGGNHPTYGVFLGGSPLDNDYWLTDTRHYRFTSQCRGAKVINSIKQALLSAINSKESQNQVLSLFKHYHKFTVEDMIARHEFQYEEPDPEIDLIINQETAASIQLYFELYKNYEFDDFGLPWLVVESSCPLPYLIKSLLNLGMTQSLSHIPDWYSSSWPWTPVMLW